MKTQFKHADLVFIPGEVIFYNNVKRRIWTVWKASGNGQTHECKICVNPRATRSNIIEKYNSVTI